MNSLDLIVQTLSAGAAAGLATAGKAAVPEAAKDAYARLKEYLADR
jgi:hypothetical protein